MTNKEMNEAVARKLGWHGPSDELKKQFPDAVWNTMPDYCGDIRAAWEIVELMKNQNSFLSVDWDSSHEEKWFCTNGHNGASADTAPMAICIAFLKLP